MGKRKKITSIAFASATAATAFGFHAAPAMATSGTWKVSPGGHFTGKNTTSASLVAQSKSGGNVSLKCPKSTASTSGSLISQPATGASVQVGTITKANFGTGSKHCSLDGFMFSAKINMGPYKLFANSYTPGTSGSHNAVVGGNIKSISEVITGISSPAGGPFSCNMVVSNKSAGSPLPGKYHNAGHSLVIDSGDTPALHIKTVTGCLDLFSASHMAYFNGTFSIMPPQTVTDP